MFDVNFRFSAKSYMCIQILRSMGLHGGQNIRDLNVYELCSFPFMGLGLLKGYAKLHRASKGVSKAM